MVSEVVTTPMYIAKITNPTLIQTMVNNRPRIVLGVISPYLERVVIFNHMAWLNIGNSTDKIDGIELNERGVNQLVEG